MKKFLMNVGAEKAGTTWLHSYFQKHPEFHDSGKELNVIQRDDLVPSHCPSSPSYQSDLEYYFDTMAETTRYTITGDFTHYEGSTENIFRLFKRELDKRDIEVVPVYIMRDPIKRAWSAWNMLGGRHNFDMPLPASRVMKNFLQCKYEKTIISLDSVFDNPLYFFYEDFFKQSNMDMICGELNIANRLADFTAVNEQHYNREVPREFVDKFCEDHKYVANFVFERFGNVPW